MTETKVPILIATTNSGKFSEITTEFQDLAFEFFDLKKEHLDNLDIDEDQKTTWENALKKAKAYAEKSGKLTIAEDTSFCVDYLKGEPGLKAKRFGKTASERNTKILDQLEGVPAQKRGASFQTSACIYDPKDKSFSILNGEVRGMIAEKISTASREGLGYDSIFYYPPLKKTFADLTLLEKNSVSHRGQVTSKLKYYLMKHFAFRQIFAPAAIIIQENKFLMTKRRDLRPKFNNKWEFPGGGIENGENIRECLKREVKEETGYNVEILEQLPEVFTTTQDRDYQVHLLLFVCKIKSGKFKTADSEINGHGWFTYKESIKMEMLTLNKKSIQEKNNKKVLLKYLV